MRAVKRLLERFTKPARNDAEPKAPGELGLDLLDPDFIHDPYPYYAYLREHDPVHRSKQGSWIVTRYAEIEQIFSNPAFGNAPARQAVVASRNSERYTAASVAGNILPFLDKPAQIRPRKMVGSAFRAALRDVQVDLDTLASDHLRRASSGGPFDVIADFAEPVSNAVISRLLALPDSDAAQLKTWAGRFFFLFAPFPDAEALAQTNAALEEFRSYLGAEVERRRRQPGADVLSALITGRDEDGPLSDMEVVDNAMLLFADGVENIGRGFANLLLCLDQNPDSLARLRDDAGLVQKAVAEALRHDPPAQGVARVVRENVVFGGRPMRADQAVLLMLASANRDPAVFVNPDRFDLDRDAEPQLTFGRGRHSCLGGTLVRMEMEAMLRAMLRDDGRFELLGRAHAYEPRLGHRWLKSLPTRLTLH